jgi:hypothetical protein
MVSTAAGDPSGVPKPSIALSLSLFCDGVGYCIDMLIVFCFQIVLENV